jgi:hypothetical protein
VDVRNAGDCRDGSTVTRSVSFFRTYQGPDALDLQCADSKNHDDRNLLLLPHLQVPDEEDGKDRIRPVSSTSDSGVAVEYTDNNKRIHARSLASGELGPEVRAWHALEQEDEEETEAVNLGNGEYSPDYRFVNLVDGQAKQHNTNAGLDEHVGNKVERLAKPPELQRVSSYTQI